MDKHNGFFRLCRACFDHRGSDLSDKDLTSSQWPVVHRGTPIDGMTAAAFPVASALLQANLETLDGHAMYSRRTQRCFIDEQLFLWHEEIQELLRRFDRFVMLWTPTPPYNLGLHGVL